VIYWTDFFVHNEIDHKNYYNIRLVNYILALLDRICASISITWTKFWSCYDV